jgi:hypothetical protein
MSSSKKAKGKGKGKLLPRAILVASHTRMVPGHEDADDDPIVQPMTRTRLRGMSPANQEKFKVESMEAILAACSHVEASGIKKYFNRAPTSAGAGPSGVTPATGNDDAKATKKAKKTPDTPDGLTPSQRDGAPGRAILAYSPWVFGEDE